MKTSRKLKNYEVKKTLIKKSREVTYQTVMAENEKDALEKYKNPRNDSSGTITISNQGYVTSGTSYTSTTSINQETLEIDETIEVELVK